MGRAWDKPMTAQGSTGEGVLVGAHGGSSEPPMCALHSGGVESSLLLGAFLMLTIEGHGQMRESLYLFWGAANSPQSP